MADPPLGPAGIPASPLPALLSSTITLHAVMAKIIFISIFFPYCFMKAGCNFRAAVAPSWPCCCHYPRCWGLSRMPLNGPWGCSCSLVSLQGGKVVGGVLEKGICAPESGDFISFLVALLVSSVCAAPSPFPRLMGKDLLLLGEVWGSSGTCYSGGCTSGGGECQGKYFGDSACVFIETKTFLA